MDTVTSTDAPEGGSPAPRVRPDLAIDLLVAVGLAVVAAALRITLPVDGWFFDDAWQVLGATHGRLSELRVTGQTQPVYNAALTAWARLFGSGEASMAAPALIAGMLGPPALYLVLRSLRTARSIALVVASSLAVVPIHIAFSGRVKVYTVELLVVLGLVLLVPRLADRRWSATTALAWVAGSLVLAGSSSFLLIAAAAAGLTLVLHPRGDRGIRAAALVAQGLGSAVLLVVTRSTLDVDAVSRQWGRNGGYVALRPLSGVIGELDAHGRRVVEALVDQPTWLVRLALLVAVVGLALSAWRGPHAVVARFLGIAALAALLGSVLERVPFGSTTAGDTRRVSLWLVPVVGVGIAMALQRVRDACGRVRRGRLAFDVVADGLAVALLAGSITDRPTYGRSGAREAVELAAAEAGPGDAIWFTRASMYPGALYSGRDVGVRPTPDDLVGFAPDFDDPLVRGLPFGPVPADAVESVAAADRVFVVHATSFRTGIWADQQREIALTLTILGFEPTSEREVGTGTVTVWERP